MKRILLFLVVMVLVAMMFSTVAMAAEPASGHDPRHAACDIVQAYDRNAEADGEAAAVFADAADPPEPAVNYTQIIIAIAIIIAVFAAMWFIIPYLIKKGVNMSGVLSTTTNVLTTADKVVDEITEYFPEVPALALIDKIIGWARKGTEMAEQLYKSSQIAAEQRKEKATELVYDYIEYAGIELDDKMKKIVAGSIEAAVGILEKTHKATEDTKPKKKP